MNSPVRQGHITLALAGLPIAQSSRITASAIDLCVPFGFAHRHGGRDDAEVWPTGS